MRNPEGDRSCAENSFQEVIVCVWGQLHRWVTEDGVNPLPLEEEHCTAVEVTEEEVQNSVKLIPSLSAVVSDRSLLSH